MISDEIIKQIIAGTDHVCRIVTDEEEYEGYIHGPVSKFDSECGHDAIDISTDEEFDLEVDATTIKSIEIIE